MPYLRSVFLLLKNVHVFTRSGYKKLDKRLLNVFQPFYYSHIPELKSKEIRFPLMEEQFPLIENNHSVFIIDQFISSAFGSYIPQARIMFNELNATPSPCELFEINKIWDKYSLFFNYSSNKGKIGEPHRDDFFIGEMEKNRIYEVLINGYYYDQGNHQRYYTEHCYKIFYAGTFIIHPILSRNPIYKKLLPIGKTRTINMRRLFY